MQSQKFLSVDRNNYQYICTSYLFPSAVRDKLLFICYIFFPLFLFSLKLQFILFIISFDLITMFAKIKQFLIEKAFSLAFMRYDKNASNTIDKDELASLINDVFQLIKIPRKVSWFQTAVIVKLFDLDNNDTISKQEAFQAIKSALSKFGGIEGIAKYAGFNKAQTVTQEKDQYSYIPKQEVEQQGEASFKISGKLYFEPPQDIDESMLSSLPPVGRNLQSEDLQKLKEEQNGQEGFIL